MKIGVISQEEGIMNMVVLFIRLTTVKNPNLLEMAFGCQNFQMRAMVKTSEYAPIIA
jgi:hypothetical protein